MRLTTTAANSSYTLCSSRSPISPMKKPKFRVAASSTKKPKITFSRFIRLLPGCRALYRDDALYVPQPQLAWAGARRGLSLARRSACVTRSPRECLSYSVGARSSDLALADRALVVVHVEQRLRSQLIVERACARWKARTVGRPASGGCRATSVK